MTFTLLGGRLKMAGAAPAEDALWLCASVAEVAPKCRILDAGAGAGVAGLALKCRLVSVEVVGVEIQPELAEQANANAALNGFENYTCVAGDVLNFNERVDAVICNPPFHAEVRGHHAEDVQKQLAHHMPPQLLTNWITHFTTLTDGPVYLVLHSANEGEVKALAEKLNLKGVVLPLATQARKPPKRMLVRLVKGGFDWQVRAALPTYEKHLREQVLRDMGAIDY